MASSGTIRHSVGDGGKNKTADVIIVQMLLKNTFNIMISDWPPGNVGDSTIAAIKQFQKDVVKLKKPDGLVEPGGMTIKALTFVKLPLSGNGYYAYGGGIDEKRWGTPDTVDSLVTLARKVKGQLNIEIGISDISLRTGRKLPPHKGHRKGVEVDIRPIRTDGKSKPCHITWAVYDQERTKKLVELILEDKNAVKILFNDTAIDGVVWETGHHHHLHVKYALQSHPMATTLRSIEKMIGSVERGLMDLLNRK